MPYIGSYDYLLQESSNPVEQYVAWLKNQAKLVSLPKDEMVKDLMAKFAMDQASAEQYLKEYRVAGSFYRLDLSKVGYRGIIVLRAANNLAAGLSMKDYLKKMDFGYDSIDLHKLVNKIKPVSKEELSSEEISQINTKGYAFTE